MVRWFIVLIVVLPLMLWGLGLVLTLISLPFVGSVAVLTSQGRPDDREGEFAPL
jgi:hypothetical protein